MSAREKTLSDTVEFVPDFRSPERAVLPRVQVDLAALSDRGKVRPNNEDHYLAVDYGRFLNCLHTNLPPGTVPGRFEETGYGLLVADGMGGEQAGEVASRMAIATLLELVIETPDWIMSQDVPEVEEVERRQSARLQRVSETLAAAGEQDSQLQGMGTTMTLAMSLGAHLLVAHVGDSRAYLLRNNSLHRLTRDHTFAQGLADAGVIPMGDVSSNRLRHMLTRSLGRREEVRADFRRASLHDGDRLLLCSDGLTEILDDGAIADILARHPTSTEACRALVERALEQGGKDNVTVVLAGYTIGG